MLLLALLVFPVIRTIALSFNTGRGLEFREWVGFENYSRLFTEDKRFLDLSEFPPQGALVNNVLWLVLYTSVCLILGLLIAVLATRVRYESFIKAIIFVPMAISAVAVGLIWKFVYSNDPTSASSTRSGRAYSAPSRSRSSAVRTRSTTRSSSPTCGRRRASPWSCSQPR